MHGTQTLLAQQIHLVLPSEPFLLCGSNPYPKWHELEVQEHLSALEIKVLTTGRIFLLLLIISASQTSGLTSWPSPFHFQGVVPWPSVC